MLSVTISNSIYFILLKKVKESLYILPISISYQKNKFYLSL